jgi:Tol biopolymer transport system component
LVRSPGGNPHWSSDGSTLAFGACLNPPDCTTGVALMERSTGEVRGFPMPDPDLFTACAIWAPSGRTLACEGNNEDGTRNGVYTVRASDGKGLTRITRNPKGSDYPLAYSPDGSLLLIGRGPGDESAKQALFVVPAHGGKPRRITPLGYSDDSASWSPDGRTIVFGTSGYLYRVSPDGTGLAKIAIRTPDGSVATSAFDVSFSPDGRRIVFSLGGAQPGIYLASADGSDVRQLTTSPTEDHHASWGSASGS